MQYWKNLWGKLRYSGLRRLILDGLGRIGIRITPYYIVQEGLFDKKLPHLETGFDEYDVGFLKPKDMKMISSIPGRNVTEEILLSRLKDGNLCFAVKHQGQLAAFTWCNLRESTFPKGSTFQLKDNEAYLFDAYTLMSFRGKGIAPYMRYQLYKELAKLGKSTLFSISDSHNIPSIKFKKKLNAKFLKKHLYIQLFNSRCFNLLLKKDGQNL